MLGRLRVVAAKSWRLTLSWSGGGPETRESVAGVAVRYPYLYRQASAYFPQLVESGWLVNLVQL